MKTSPFLQIFRNSGTNSTWSVIWLCVLLGLLGGCESTKQARVDSTSCFLNDYSILRVGKVDEADRIYRKPLVDWKSYRKVLLDPVSIWKPSQKQLDAHAEALDLEHFADYFYHALYQSLSNDYEMVFDPGPDTLRVQAAITNIEQSWVILDVITAMPGVDLFSRVKEYTTGKPLFTGGTSIEFKVVDAKTQDLLMAGVDRRVGTKDIDADAFDSWADAEAAMNYWAQQARWRFCTLRGDINCVRPGDEEN